MGLRQNLNLERIDKLLINSYKQDLEIQLVDFCDGDDQIEWDMEYYIRCFGITENSKSVSVKITGFKPYFFICCENINIWDFKKELEEKDVVKINLKKCQQFISTSKLISLEKYLNKQKINLKNFDCRNYFTNDLEFNHYGNQYPSFIDSNK